MSSYRVYVRSRPGTWEVYDGHIDVELDAVTFVEVEEAAIGALNRLYNRGRDAWIVERIELIRQ